MFLSRSLARVRPLGPMGYGFPFVLDWKRGDMKPYFGTGEWGRTSDGRIWQWASRIGRMVPLYPTMRELLWMASCFRQPHGQFGIGISAEMQFRPMSIGYSQSGTTSITTTSLNSAYTYGSAGASSGWRYELSVAKTISSVYAHIASFSGSAASVTSLQVEVRNETSSAPGSTLHDAQTHNPASTTGWRQFTGFSFTGSANTPYWVCYNDPAGDGHNYATDFAVISRTFAGHAISAEDNCFPHATTTNGYSSMTPLSSQAYIGVTAFSDGTVMGNPFTASAASTSGTQKRGLLVDGFSENVTIFGAVTVNNLTGCNGLSVIADEDGPAATPLRTFTNPSYTPATPFGMIGAPFNFQRHRKLRFAYTYGSAATSPHRYQIGTGADANLRKAMLGGGGMYYAEENTGSGNWANDNISEWPRMALLVKDVGQTQGRRADYSLGVV